MSETIDTVVRPARQPDLKLCLQFEHQDEFGRRTPIDEKIVSASIDVGGIFIAEQHGVAVGYASLNFLYASRKPLLSWWYVAAEHRHQGVGSKLLHALETHLRALGFTELLISACREKEIDRHRSAGLREIGALNLGANEAEHFFIKLLGEDMP